MWRNAGNFTTQSLWQGAGQGGSALPKVFINAVELVFFRERAMAASIMLSRRWVMDFATIDRRLLSYPGAAKAFHEKWGWMVYWVGGRQFACEFAASPDAKPPYAGRHLLSLKCDPDRILELRAECPDAILPGYYSDGRTWISVDLDADLPESLVFGLCDLSYELVFAKLPKRVQREVAGD